MKLIALYKESFSGLRPQVWYLALMMLVNRMGSLILPFLTLYTTQQLGWSITDSGLASAAFGVGSMLGAWSGGWLVDRFGYRNIIVIGQFGAAFAFFSLQYFTDFYPMVTALFLSAAVADILRPGVMTGVTVISDESTKTRAISLMRMAFNLGLSIGPAFAGVIISFTSYRSIFIVDAATCFAAGIFALIFIHKDRDKKKPRPQPTPEQRGQTPYNDMAFMSFMFWTMIMLLAFFQILFTIPLYMKEVLLLNETDVGIYFAINGLIIFISEMPIVYITERKWRLMPATILGSIMIGLSFLCLLLPFSPWTILILFLLLISYGEIINFPFITSLSMRRTNPSNVGQYMGVIAMLFSFSIILAPVIGTQMIARFGYGSCWILSCVFCLVAAAGFKHLDKEFKKSDPRPLSA